jgi:alpha-D-ribose 1-methylphosphonate 5-triphosphate synthase subunit PhnG
MDRKTQFEILARASSAIIPIAEEILRSADIELIKKPQTFLLMARATDSVTSCPFNLGEILVTEAEVRLGTYIGYSLIMGEEPEKALAAAVIDAALQGDDVCRSLIEEKLLQEKRRHEMEQQQEFSLVAQTRVEFEVVKE